MWPFRKKSTNDRHKKVLTSAKKQFEGKVKYLHITPPEGVQLDLPLASISLRFGAQLVDWIVTMVAAILLCILALYAFQSSWSVIVIFFSLTFFLIRIPYYVLTELAWNGRTLAKRWLGLRVVSVLGRSLTPHQVVTRNIMREIEFFAPLTYLLMGHTIHWILSVIAFLWIIILIVIVWRSKRNQRIGDIIANTAVILNPKPMLLVDISQPVSSTDRFAFSTQQLDHYGRFELQVLEQVLRAPSASLDTSVQKKRSQHEASIVDRIVRKIEYPERIEQRDRREFLQNFYTAQRAHLENRKLFGDARDDKFFKEDEKQD